MPKIVIIDDDNLLRAMYADKIKQAGFDVHVYGDGKRGLTAIKKLVPTLVLSDIMMPSMSGLEVLKAMKKDPKLKKIPLVFLTNLNRSDDDIKNGLSLGAVGYLVKSDLSPSEIVARVKEIISAHVSIDELPETAAEKLKRVKKNS